MDQTEVEETVAKIVEDTGISMDVDDDEEGPLQIAETEPEQADDGMDVEDENSRDPVTREQGENPEEEEEEESFTPEQVQKSLDLKNEFLELFDIAPKLRNILVEIKNFMANPEITRADRIEIQSLVEKRMNEEKAAKKKAKKEEIAKTAAAPAVTTRNELAEAIKNVVGIDLSSLLGNKQQQQPEPIIPSVPLAPQIIQPTQYGAPVPQFLPTPQYLPPLPQPQYPTQSAPPRRRPNSLIKTDMPIKYGKAGFGTPNPKDVPEIPEQLRTKKPEDICPIPPVLKGLGVDDLQVAPLPNQLLPPALRKKEPVEYLGPIIRKTLYLAGARPAARMKLRREQENIQFFQETIDPDNFKLPPGVAPISDELLRPKDGNAKRRRNREKADEYKNNLAKRDGPNAMEASLHRDSPIAVKRYHARQLAKETGMTLEEALDEIEEQCRSFKDRPMSPVRNNRSSGRVKHVDDMHVPIDHSRGIPGIDRPPVGYSRDESSSREPPQKKRRGGVREREKRERRENESGGGGGGRGFRDRDRGFGGGGGGDRGGNRRNGGRGGGGGGRNRYDDYNQGGGGGGGYSKYQKDDYSKDAYSYDNSYNQETYESQSGAGEYEGYYEANASGKYGESSTEGYDAYYGYDNNSYDGYYGSGSNDQQSSAGNSAGNSGGAGGAGGGGSHYYQQNTGLDYPSTYHATYSSDVPKNP